MLREIYLLVIMGQEVLCVPFKGHPRLEDTDAMREFRASYVYSMLSVPRRVWTLSSVLDIYKQQLESLRRIRQRADYLPWDKWCASILPPINYKSAYRGVPNKSFSETHRAIVSIVRRCFGVEARLCMGSDKRSRLYDFRGSRVDLLAFLPVIDFMLSGYSVVMFMRVQKMTCLTAEKLVRRAHETAEFLAELERISNDFLAD